jgi:hypothetical protein
VFSSGASSNKLNVSVAVLFSYTINLMLTRCSIFDQA